MKINDCNVKIASAEFGKVSLRLVNDSLTNFDKLYEFMNDEEKRQAISGLIEEIEIHEHPIKNNYIKTIKVKFAVSKKDSLSLEVNGDVLYEIDDLSENYIENTYYEANGEPLLVKPKKKKITYKMIQDYVYDKYGFKVH